MELPSPTFANNSTLSTTLTSAEFTETKEIEFTGEVTASETGVSIYKALAITQDNLSNDDVIALLNNESYAEAFSEEVTMAIAGLETNYVDLVLLLISQHSLVLLLT